MIDQGLKKHKKHYWNPYFVMELFSNLLFTFFMLIVIQLLLWQSAKL